MPSWFVKTVSRNCLKEKIESAMNYLANHGYGTLLHKAFYENPHLGKEQLKRTLVEPHDYMKTLNLLLLVSAETKANMRHV